jgi:hypothetical protein
MKGGSLEAVRAGDHITGRAVIVGLLLVAFVNVWPIYGLYVIHISQMVFSYMPMALMIPFVLLALGVNVALRRLRPGAAFSPLELAAVFSMGLIGALFPAMNFTGLIMGHLASPYYFASAENRWAEFLHPYLPSYLFPPDRDGAMRHFFEGLPDGRPIPYGVWIGPLIWWFAFAGALTSVLTTLHLGYSHGAYNFNAFEFQTHPGIFNYYVNQMQTALPPDWKRLGFFGIGSAVMGLLMLLRYRCAWWPLHPVGFAIMETRAYGGRSSRSFSYGSAS